MPFAETAKSCSTTFAWWARYHWLCTASAVIRIRIRIRVGQACRRDHCPRGTTGHGTSAVIGLTVLVLAILTVLVRLSESESGSESARLAGENNGITATRIAPPTRLSGRSVIMRAKDPRAWAIRFHCEEVAHVSTRLVLCRIMQPRIRNASSRTSTQLLEASALP